MKERKIFDIVLNGRLNGVWDRPNHKHTLGQMNGCPDTWWVKYVRREEEEDHEVQVDWIPFIDKGTNRASWDIRIKQGNVTKFKWDEWQINKTGYVELTLNNRVVDEFGFNDLNYAFAKAQLRTFEMCEHPFNFFDPESEIGRKIYYHRQPAIINRLILDQGCIMVEKEDGTGFDLRGYKDEDMSVMGDWHGANMVKTSIMDDKNIIWFRE